ncbi:MAG: hydrogenase expression/formation protein HypE [Cellvibrionaceae bacterium]|nr:hydrogenase expression/formation protein HypE [Cellvibrionaceae bacterium]MCV6624579.1 hydrogenase expression/formation protein HypE [Cellvibrionaceae bacterium]
MIDYCKPEAGRITLAHGAGGSASRDLIEQLFVPTFASTELSQLEDQARFELASLTQLGQQLAMTTDSYVVDPLFFNGGDIGALAVNGTVNDLCVGGALPLYLSCGFVLEEGLPIATLVKVVKSMKAAADLAGVRIVTGDTKVVPKGAADKLFINTSGIGVIPEGVNISSCRATVGDKVLINGYIGDHGAAILDARGELMLESNIASDCRALNGLVQTLLQHCPDIHCLRDATRGGLATVLNEFALASGTNIQLQESQLPLRPQVRAVCELLGLEPMYLANEGKLVAIVPGQYAEPLLSAMRAHPAGRHAAIIGEVQQGSGQVSLRTLFGGERLMDMLVGEQLPRIC